MESILTVNTPAASLDLTVLATVKLKFGITGTDEDVKISQWIKEASDFIANYCHRVFGKENVTELFRPECYMEYFVLKRIPIVSVTEVIEDGTTLAAANYEIDSDVGAIYRLDDNDVRISWLPKKITIKYDAGYVLMGELPYDIEAACIELIKEARSAATREPLAKRIEIPDVETVDYWVGGIGESTFGLPAQVKATLDLYRIANV